MKENRVLFPIIYIVAFLSFQGINAASPEFHAGAELGYNGGKGWNLSGDVFHFAQDFPLGLRLNLGRSVFNPGNAVEARKIFINNNQGGTIEKSGSVLLFTLDFLYPISIFHLPESYLFAGPRYASFRGNFKFVGNNEDFDVTSKHWGFGIGLDNRFTISNKVKLVLTVGTTLFAQSTLYGHDTSYSPDNENVNPRENYQFGDADNAVNQPHLEWQLMGGISYSIGK